MSVVSRVSKVRTLCALSTALLLSGCDALVGPDCVALGVAGVVVTVTDAVTGGAPISPPALRLIDGAYREDVQSAAVSSGTPPRLVGAVERPGTYRVEVYADGYAVAIREGVAVRREGRCNAIVGVQLSVPLTRLP